MDKHTQTLLQELPPGPAYTLLAMHNQLVRISTDAEFSMWLRDMQEMVMGMPPMLLAVTGYGRHHQTLNRVLNCGWSENWIQRYVDEDFRLVDPILTADHHQPVRWSQEFAKNTRPSVPLKRFLQACRNNGMAHGVTFIAQETDHRVYLSMAGRDAEDNTAMTRMMWMIWPHIANAARKWMLPRNRLYELSPRELDVFNLIGRGSTYGHAAIELGIDVTTVRTHVEHMKVRFGAKNSRHLVKILLSDCD